MKRKVKRPFDNEQFRKGYVAGIFAAEKELNTELLHFAEKAHKIMSEGTFPDYGVKINFKDSNNTIATNLDMTTEEKAKRYDEALEWMRELYPGLHGATKEDAEHYFPELKESKESEDERIRKEIISFLQDDIDRINCRVSGDYDDRDEDDIEHQNWCKKAIAYLEKQKINTEGDFGRGYDCGYKACLNSHGAEFFEKQKEPTKEELYAEAGTTEKEYIANTMKIVRAMREKQKEQIPYIDFVIKPHKGDDTNPYDMGVSEAQEYAIKRGFSVPFNDGEVYVDERHITQTVGNILRWADEHPKEQKPEAKLTGWVARDSKYNSYFGLGLVLFKGKPRRSGECWSGAIAAQLPWEMFPDLKWMDEPVEVEVTITKK